MKANALVPDRRGEQTRTIGCERGWLWPNFIAVRLDETEDRAELPENPGNVGLNGLPRERLVIFSIN
jgi:hypothetical protein